VINAFGLLFFRLGVMMVEEKEKNLYSFNFLKQNAILLKNLGRIYFSILEKL